MKTKDEIKRHYKNSYENRTNKNISFEQYMRYIIISHPTILNNALYEKAYPKIIKELKTEIKNTSKIEVKNKIIKNYEESR